jgi:DNA-binding NtrC family response regulator
MTKVLVVHHDIDLADQEVDSLRRLGYEPVECAGPAGFPCPVLRGEHCPQVHEADVLLSDVWSTTESGGGKALIEGLREMHPEIPIILTAPGMELDWVETEGVHKVIPLVGVPTAERLDAAIKEALADEPGRD